jgi:hypothetical protein
MRYNNIEEFRKIRTTLRENKTFDFDTYKDELIEMTKRMDDEALLVQSKLSHFIAKSDYNSGGGGKAGTTVSMTMSHNHHEKSKGLKLKGSWETKYHEEGHVLDHVLVKFPEFNQKGTGKYQDDNKGYMLGFMNITKEYGEQACDAVGADILAFINKAIDWSNTTYNTSIKAQKSLARIAGESKEATIQYLRDLVHKEKIDAVYLGILTDAIGCYTKAGIHPYSHGFWGHNTQYCKDGGKQLAVAETWATWNYLREAGSEDELEILKTLMPNTHKNFTSTYSKVAEWLKDNELYKK